MASTGSIGMTRPMKKVTQVSPRNVSATENSTLMTRRMGPARRRTHSSGADIRRQLVRRRYSAGACSRATDHVFVMVRKK